MKFLKSLPARLLLAIAVGILAGFVLPEDAMKVIVTVKYILGQVINFCVPLIIIGFIAPSITLMNHLCYGFNLLQRSLLRRNVLRDSLVKMMTKRMIGCRLVIVLLLCACCGITAAAAGETEDVPVEKKLVPFSDIFPVGLEMSMEEFEKQTPALISAAEKWDRETVPQTLDEFPIAIAPFMDVFSRISAAHSALTVEDRQYLWETDLGGLFTENVPDRFDISLDYEDSECSVYLPPIQEKDDTFLFEIPDGVTRSDVKSVSYDCFWYPSDEWYVILQIHYDIKNDVLDDMPYVCIYYTGEEYSFSFGTDLSGEFMTDMFAIHIGKIHENTVNPLWDLAYSMKDGKIIGMENDNQQIDFRD